MKEIDLKWTDCEFGIDSDGKLKLIIDIEYKDHPPKELLLIIMVNCLSSIIEQNGLKTKQIFADAIMRSYKS